MIMAWEALVLAHFSLHAGLMTATRTHPNRIHIACAATMMMLTRSRHCGMRSSVFHDVKITGSVAWSSAFTEGWGTIDTRFVVPPCVIGPFFRPLDQAVGSGDTFEDWKTLTFQIYLTLTAANVAVEWNHDLVIWLHDVPIRVACSTEVSQTL